MNEGKTKNASKSASKYHEKIRIAAAPQQLTAKMNCCRLYFLIINLL